MDLSSPSKIQRNHKISTSNEVFIENNHIHFAEGFRAVSKFNFQTENQQNIYKIKH